jgi:hypothetical protein
MLPLRLVLVSCVAFGLLLCPCRASAQAKIGAEEVQPFHSYGDLLDMLRKRGHKWRVLGYAPDKSPIVVVRAGGDKLPPILISAGSHSTEHAGVRAAVELVDRLKTKHQVWMLPCRDPIGLNGFRYALGLGLGEEPKIQSLAEAEKLMREKGEVLFDSDGALLVVIGEYGYANRGLTGRLKKGDKALEALKGRRVWYPSTYQDVPGSALFERAYILIVTPDGEVLHMNRFHDTAWAPAEVRCIRQLMAEIKPGLTFDLHEHGGDSYWFSARKQRTDDDEAWELRLAGAMIKAVATSGAKLAAEDYSPGAFFSKIERGVYWLDPSKRGEGLNLADFAAQKYGLGFTVETGVRQPFARRVDQHLLTVKTAVKLFEERYR